MADAPLPPTDNQPPPTPPPVPAAPADSGPPPLESVVAAAPVAEPAPTAPLAAAPESPSDAAAAAPVETSLLTEAKAPADPAAPTDTKPADAKPAEPAAPEVKADDATPAEPAAEPAAPAAPAPPEAVEYKYELPPTLALDDKAKGELHGLLDNWRAKPAELQPLIDYHARQLGAAIDAERANQHRAFSQTKQAWRTEAMADEVIGGAGWQTAQGVIGRARDRFISDAPHGSDQWKADLRAFTLADLATGFGNNPIILRMFHRIGQFIDEPAAPSPDIKAAPQPRPRGGTLYDNPRSNVNGRE